MKSLPVRRIYRLAVAALALAGALWSIVAVGFAVAMAAHFQQQGFGAVTQLAHVHAGRHRKQHVAHLGAIAAAVARRLRVEVAAAGLVRRLGNLQLGGQQRLDGGTGGFAGAAVQTWGIVHGQQPGLHRRLAQQFGAGALAQAVVVECLAGGVQRHAVDACDRGREGGIHGRPFSCAPAACCVRPAGSAAANAPPDTGGTGRPPRQSRSTRAPGG